MKKFNLNDFVEYFPTCLNCNKKNKFAILSDLRTERDVIITNKSIVIPLLISYSKNINLEIDRKTNKLLYLGNKTEIITYLEDRKFWLRSYCFLCRSFTETNVLNFNILKNILNAITLQSETLCVRYEDDNYYVNTNFQSMKTDIEKLSFKPGKRPVLDFKTQISAFPKYKWNTKEALVKKVSKLENFK